MKKSREDVAAARFEIISPLLSASSDAVLRIEKQKEVAWHFGKSYRTIGRWLKAYEISGFAGLKPKKTCPNQGSALPENQAKILEAAITLRRECPSRSVRDIIQILELEGIAAKGALRRFEPQHVAAALATGWIRHAPDPDVCQTRLGFTPFCQVASLHAVSGRYQIRALSAGWYRRAEKTNLSSRLD